MICSLRVVRSFFGAMCTEMIVDYLRLIAYSKYRARKLIGGKILFEVPNERTVNW